MRIRKGRKVEVWDAEASAWRAGVVTWGNGHSYNIKWFDGGPDSLRIRRKFVRPIPVPDPKVKLPKDFVSGDIVELFDSNQWKWVEVVRVGVGDGQLDVRFFGYTNILTVDVSVLRPRLIYGVEGWALMHKNDRTPIPSRPIAGKNIKSKATGNGGTNFGAHAIKPNKKKRSNCTVDSNIVRDVKRFQGDTNRLFTKRQEPAAGYNDTIEVMDVHPSHYLKKPEEETGYNVDVYLARRTDRDKNDGLSKSDTSSSTSDTSTSDSSNRSRSGGDCADSDTVEHFQNDREEQDSDSRRLQHHQASEVQEVMKQEEQMDCRVHALELEAFASVMKAFHAIGSLTWTKEVLLSDLRQHLHVSNDEHLQVIWGLNGKKKPAGGPRNESTVCQNPAMG